MLKSIFILIVIAIIGIIAVNGMYQGSIPSSVDNASNGLVSVSINDTAMSIEALGNVSGVAREMTYSYGSFGFYLFEGGDAKLGGSGTIQNIDLKKGQIMVIPVFKENVNHHEIGFHGRYEVPFRVVQTLTVETIDGAVEVRHRF